MTTNISDHASRFLSAVPLGDMLLVSDYAKGVCASGMLQVLGDRARAAGVPILVDPARSRNWSDYGQVTLIKANRAEADAVAEEAHPLAMARRLADEHGCHVVVTLGRFGLVCADRDGATWYMPARPAQLRDVCGAGDTVLAAIAFVVSQGTALRGACKLATQSAALQVAALGITAVQSVA